MNTRQKMWRSNAKAKEWLNRNGFKEIYMAPHTRHSKDIHLGGLAFDGVAVSKDILCFFQIKSNKKPSAKQLDDMEIFTAQYGALAFWFNYVDYEGLEVYPNDVYLGRVAERTA